MKREIKFRPIESLRMPMSSFLDCAKLLSLDTGDDLETVGMSSETDTVSICIYGDADKEYAIEVSDFVIRLGEKWIPVPPMPSQKAALQALLSNQVEELREKRNADIERTMAQLDRENEIERYGREDTLYNDNY